MSVDDACLQVLTVTSELHHAEHAQQTQHREYLLHLLVLLELAFDLERHERQVYVERQHLRAPARRLQTPTSAVCLLIDENPDVRRKRRWCWAPDVWTGVSSDKTQNGRGIRAKTRLHTGTNWRARIPLYTKFTNVCVKNKLQRGHQRSWTVTHRCTRIPPHWTLRKSTSGGCTVVSSWCS